MPQSYVEQLDEREHDHPAVLATLRGTKKERAQLKDEAAEARVSLNVYIRQKLGLPAYAGEEVKEPEPAEPVTADAGPTGFPSHE